MPLVAPDRDNMIVSMGGLDAIAVCWEHVDFRIQVTDLPRGRPGRLHEFIEFHMQFFTQ